MSSLSRKVDGEADGRADKRLYKAPPQGSVVLEAASVVKRLFQNGGWKKCWKGGDAFWNEAKPTNIAAAEGSLDVKKVFWDDKFVDELRQSFSACKIFLLIPVSPSPPAPTAPSRKAHPELVRGADLRSGRRRDWKQRVCHVSRHGLESCP